MKKHIFLFVIAVFSCLQVMGEVVNWTPVKTTEMNPFAYNLKAELSNDKRNITISYCLNATAASVNIVFYNGESVYKIVSCSGLSKTTASDPYATTGYSVTIPTTDLPINTNLSWRIEVQGPGRANCGVYSQDGTNIYRHKFYRPSSVDIVQDPTSGNYGKVLVVESNDASRNTAMGTYHSSKMTKTKGENPNTDDPQGAGIYVFNPDLTPRENSTGTYVFNGKSDNRLKGTKFAPYRVRVSEDGRMFVSSLYPNGDILWEVDANFSTWTTVIGKGLPGTTWTGDQSGKGNTDADYCLNTTGGAFIAAPCAGLDVRGKGKDLKLLLLSCTGYANANAYRGFHTHEYNLGTKTTWNQAPSKDFQTNKGNIDINPVTGKPLSVFVHKNNSNVVYDKDGGIWCISYREACNDEMPGLAHKTANAEEDCRIARSNTKNAALRFNKTFTRAMMAGDGNNGTLYNYIPDHGSNNTSQGYFFNHTNIDMSAVGSFLNDFAWDNANNVYAVGHNFTNSDYKNDGGEGYVAVYCLPYSASDVFTTPGPNSFILAETICWHPYPARYKVTNEDLWETFQCDYNDWYRFHPNAEEKITKEQAHQPITGAYGFTFPSDKLDNDEYKYRDGLVSDFLTDETSKWKWLGDYIKIAANPARVPADNAALWENFKVYFNIYYQKEDYYNQNNKYPRAETTSITDAATFWPGGIDNDQDNIMTNANSQYKWLGDYIKSVAESQENTIDTESAWRWHLYAFFNCTDGKYEANTQKVAASNFSEAGKPENWKPYYVSPEGKNQIDTEFEWRKEVHAFFNQTNKCGYNDVNGTWRSDNTGDYTMAGYSDQANNGANGWYNEWWDATFKPTLEAHPTDSLPTIRRKGYVLSGWYYGDNDEYSLNDRENNKSVTRNGCLWARWIESCLYEGYITGTVANSASTEEMGKQINRNFELMNLTQSKSDYPLDVDRKMQGGMYNTFAVPFAFSKEDGAFNHINKIVAANDANNQLLSNASILCFTGTSIVENGVGEYVLQLNFDEWDGSSAILANTPILVKPENNITTRMHLQWNPYINATSNHPVTHSYVTFVPVLAPSEVQGGAGTNNFILVADNRLARLSSTGTMLGLRGYFNGSQIPDNLAPQQVVVKITEKNGVVTYLDNIETPQQGAAAIKILQNGNIYILRDGKVYDVMGRPLREL